MTVKLDSLKTGKTLTGQARNSYNVIQEGKQIGEIWKTPYNTHWQTDTRLSNLCNEKIFRNTERKMLNAINKKLERKT